MSDSKAPSAEALSFNSTTFDVVERAGKVWLKAVEIGRALGYVDDKAVQRIYARHADEFTQEMTGVVKLTTPSGKQDSRVFSLRGAHLLAMFARTTVAKAFRKWVLDVLDREAARIEQEQAPTMSLTDCSDKAKVKKFLIVMRKRAVQQLVQLDKEIMKWEVLDALPPTSFIKFEVLAIGRDPRGPWVMNIRCGMCAFRIAIPHKLMPRGGVKVGDQLTAYYEKEGNPWDGPWVKVEAQGAKAPAALKYEFGKNYAALEVAA